MNSSIIYAKDLIEQLGLKPPIDLYKLCEDFNIRVVNENLKNAYAYFKMKNGKKIIFLNNSIVNTEKERFTLAHELGHYLLPNHLWNGISIYKEEDYFNRNSKKKIESDVDKFAAELLMPSIYIDDELSKIQLKDFLKLKDIANKYEVSLTSLLCKYININSENMALLYYQNGVQKWQYQVYEDLNYNFYEGPIMNYTFEQYTKDTLNNWTKEDFEYDVYQVIFDLSKYNAKLVVLEIKFSN